jgi:hypothetical protein
MIKAGIVGFGWWGKTLVEAVEHHLRMYGSSRVWVTTHRLRLSAPLYGFGVLYERRIIMLDKTRSLGVSLDVAWNVK